MIIGNIRNPPKSPDWPKYRYVKVDRSTAVGNPFKIGPDGTRKDVIDKFRDWLPKAYKENERVRSIIDRLVDHELHNECETVLLCWCDPLPCHASVIKDFVLDIVNRQIEEPGE